MTRYNAKETEAKWQRIWSEQSVFEVTEDTSREQLVAYGGLYSSNFDNHLAIDCCLLLSQSRLLPCNFLCFRRILLQSGTRLQVISIVDAPNTEKIIRSV